MDENKLRHLTLFQYGAPPNKKRQGTSGKAQKSYSAPWVYNFLDQFNPIRLEKDTAKPSTKVFLDRTGELVAKGSQQRFEFADPPPEYASSNQ